MLVGPSKAQRCSKVKTEEIRKTCTSFCALRNVVDGPQSLIVKKKHLKLSNQGAEKKSCKFINGKEFRLKILPKKKKKVRSNAKPSTFTILIPRSE